MGRIEEAAERVYPEHPTGSGAGTSRATHTKLNTGTGSPRAHGLHRHTLSQVGANIPYT